MMRRSALILLVLSGAALGEMALTTAATPLETQLPAATKEVVRYRLVDWRVVHTGKVEEAKKLAAMLIKLKCEVKQADHGNHVDIRYRCKDWKELQLPTHTAAHQWETWLKKYGFETVHEH